LSEAFVRDSNSADADQLVQAFYTEDARLLPPNLPMVTGRSQISEAFREFFEAGMGELTINTHEIEIASSGDLAYGIGTFSLGRPVPGRGKFVEVYRRAEGVHTRTALTLRRSVLGGFANAALHRTGIWTGAGAAPTSTRRI